MNILVHNTVLKDKRGVQTPTSTNDDLLNLGQMIDDLI